jgi:hypothetical protein
MKIAFERGGVKTRQRIGTDIERDRVYAHQFRINSPRRIRHRWKCYGSERGNYD